MHLTFLFKSFKIIKLKENAYREMTSKEYDKRTFLECFNDLRSKIIMKLKSQFCENLFNQKKIIITFSLCQEFHKETILCNENGYYVHYLSDRIIQQSG